MLPEIQPFNLDLLKLSPQDLKYLKEIKVQDIFDGFSKNFHPEGMFSIEIFGKVGEEKRNRMFAYIDLKIGIMHPVLFKALSELKALYKDIMAGQVYAIFNEKTKDFEKADLGTGQTGYAFFLSHFPKLKFEQRPSPKREFNIKLINKYRDDILMDKLVVMPAGLRDYVIDEGGKPTEDEINSLYRKVLGISGIIQVSDIKKNEAYLDQSRYNLQLRVNAIYDYIVNLLDGKSKLTLGKWASRKIFDTTRNVITPHISDATELDSPKFVSTSNTVVGVYQYMRATMPLTVNLVRDTFLSNIFVGPNSPAALINPETLERELVHIDPDYYDSWMTYEGIESQAARFSEETIRHNYVKIDKYYLALVYTDDNFYRVFYDIRDLPEKFDPENVRPITYAELFYLSIFKKSKEVPCLVTRYPITGYGSVYPSFVYLKSTARTMAKRELGENWEETGDIAPEYPILGENFYNSLSPAIPFLGRLGGD